jgi:excisionase family DNA binding protein
MTVMTNDDAAREYLTVAEVAERLHCSEPTIRRRIRSGELEAVKLGRDRNSAVRISLNVLDAWLRNPTAGRSTTDNEQEDQNDVRRQAA